MNNIKSTLIKIGLDERQADAYLTGLSLGSFPASIIARKMGIPRTTARNICQQLSGMGLFVESVKKNAKIFYAEPPEKLLDVIKLRRVKIEKDENLLSGVMQDLLHIYNPSVDRPKIEYFDDKEGYIKFCELSLKCESKEILFLASMENFRDIVTTEYDTNRYIPTRVGNDIRSKLLCNRCDLTEKMKLNDKEEKRETRFLPKKYEIRNTIFIFDDKVALITNEQHPSCVMITSSGVADMMRSVYLMMWDNASD